MVTGVRGNILDFQQLNSNYITRERENVTYRRRRYRRSRRRRRRRRCRSNERKQNQTQRRKGWKRIGFAEGARELRCRRRLRDDVSGRGDDWRGWWWVAMRISVEATFVKKKSRGKELKYLGKKGMRVLLIFQTCH